MNHFLSLSSDILQQILMELSSPDLIRFINTNKDNFGISNDIWKGIFERDFPVLIPNLGYFASWLHFTKGIWTLSRNIVMVRSPADSRYVNINLMISDIVNIILLIIRENPIRCNESLLRHCTDISCILLAADPKKITEILIPNDLEWQSIELMRDIAKDFHSLGIQIQDED